ncbi:hypothetical protein GWK47_033090 [Chionoecetes opilio]|uniref:ATP-dependent DNA helicase n=1 Tax=Chionoecetes opilio TaxID=41210 RepID=A0A8J4YIC4_CHIOP|nr:hypothetical protein GWK47_033090 [Chionoecetes opilio]
MAHSRRPEATVSPSATRNRFSHLTDECAEEGDGETDPPSLSLDSPPILGQTAPDNDKEDGFQDKRRTRADTRRELESSEAGNAGGTKKSEGKYCGESSMLRTPTEIVDEASDPDHQREPSPTPINRTRLLFPRDSRLTYQDKLVWTVHLGRAFKSFNALFKEGKNNPYVTVGTQEAVDMLTTIGFKDVILVVPVDSEKLTKVIIFRYPTVLDPDFLLDDSRFVWAKRRMFRGEPKSQVVALMRGPVPNRAFINGAGYRNLAPYVDEPHFCSHCSRWGHKVWKCQGDVRCRFCAKNHPSTVCRKKITDGHRVPPRCCNCRGEHNASSPLCPRRPVYPHPSVSGGSGVEAAREGPSHGGPSPPCRPPPPNNSLGGTGEGGSEGGVWPPLNAWSVPGPVAGGGDVPPPSLSPTSPLQPPPLPSSPSQSQRDGNQPLQMPSLNADNGGPLSGVIQAFSERLASLENTVKLLLETKINAEKVGSECGVPSADSSMLGEASVMGKAPSAVGTECGAPNEALSPAGAGVMTLVAGDLNARHRSLESGGKTNVNGEGEGESESVTITINLRCKALQPSSRGDDFYLPRVPIITQAASGTKFRMRLQFPIRVAFAMTINKCQDQTKSYVGVSLPTPVFTHDQLYVSLSRVDCADAVEVVAPRGITRNVVYSEAL